MQRFSRWLVALAAVALIGSVAPAASAATLPTLTINDVAVTEGLSGTTLAALTVTLSAPSSQTVTVGFSTFDGTATLGDNDYVATSGTLTISSGTTSAVIVVSVVGDNRVELDETFSVQLFSATNATIADSIGQVTILTDDLPTFSVNDATVTEGKSGTTSAVFTVTLNPAVGWTTTVTYATGGSLGATSGAVCGGSVDFLARSGTFTFAPGQTSATVAVPVCGDSLDEEDELFFVVLSSPTNARFSCALSCSNLGYGTIVDNNPPPTLSIASVAVLEGNSLGHNAVVTVTQSIVSGKTVTANWATGRDTATSGLVCGTGSSTDYLAVTGTLTIPAGQTSSTIGIPVCPDTRIEPNETFFVTLSNLSNATLSGASSATVTIANDDGKTGSFDLAPSDGSVALHQRLTSAFTWTVPDPENWHDLQTLELRIRDGQSTILRLRWNEASNTFRLFNEKTSTFGPAFAPKSNNRLESNAATLYLADTSVQGSGPTGPSVTLNLALSFKPRAAGRSYEVEVAATDDLGNQDAFMHAGTLQVETAR